MKKFVFLSALSVCALLMSGCSLKRGNQTLQRGMSSAAEDESIDDVFEKDVPIKADHFGQTNPENTHVLADATADDVAIKQAVGAKDIDEDLAPTSEEQVPYARHFLAQKKTKRMQFWVEYFTQKDRARFQRFLNNGEEYRHIIEEVFVQHGLPKELYFVGLIESGYYLGARSHAAAVGPWQFIPGTGKRYGLAITKELDERQDLFKASRAAAMYFKDLHNIFSSWELALAAYNAGEYGIIRRILKHGTRDFYVLSKRKQLPSETINYVPKVLAAMHIVNNADKYGFTLPKKQNRLFDRTELRAIKKNLPLTVIASKIDIDVGLLKKLNPELRTNRTPKHLAGTYYLRVPKSKYTYRLIGVENDDLVSAHNRPESRKQMVRRTAAVEHATDLLNNPRPAPLPPSFHTVKRGETLSSISKKYRKTPRQLASINRLRSWKSGLRVGQRLALNQDEVSVKFSSLPKLKATKNPVVYKVRSGDKLRELARIFGKDLGEMKQMNNIRKNKIVVGQKIVLPDSQKGIYTVKYGDHLVKVSKDLNSSVEEIMKLNSLTKRKIYPGQKLIVDMD